MTARDLYSPRLTLLVTGGFSDFTVGSRIQDRDGYCGCLLCYQCQRSSLWTRWFRQCREFPACTALTGHQGGLDGGFATVHDIDFGSEGVHGGEDARRARIDMMEIVDIRQQGRRCSHVSPTEALLHTGNHRRAENPAHPRSLVVWTRTTSLHGDISFRRLVTLQRNRLP